jgi:UDP-N-acetylenolpyruvoylglucosamine reductase
MTEEERKELEDCSRRIAELLYKEAVDQQRAVSTLGGIEATIRSQMQEYVTPTIGSFFAQPPAEAAKDIRESSTASSDD